MKYHERARAVLASSIRPGLRYTLLALADHADEFGVCLCGYGRLAEKTGKGKSTIRTDVLALAAAGVVTVEHVNGCVPKTTINWPVVAAPPESVSMKARSSTRGSFGTDAGSAPVPTQVLRTPTDAESSTVPTQNSAPTDAGSAPERFERVATNGSPLKAPQGAGTLFGQLPDPAPDCKAQPVPRWLSKAQLPAGTDRAALFAAIVYGIEQVTQGIVSPTRTKTNGRPLLSLWRALECPPLDEWRAEVELVARACRECPHKLFASDVRWEGDPDGFDRSRSVATVCVQRRWEERLQAARAWDGAGGALGDTAPSPTAHAAGLWDAHDRVVSGGSLDAGLSRSGLSPVEVAAVRAGIEALGGFRACRNHSEQFYDTKARRARFAGAAAVVLADVVGLREVAK